MDWRDWGVRWRVVSTGQPIQGWKDKYVIERLVEDVELDSDEANALVSGVPSVVADDLSSEAAVALAGELRQAGLEVEMHRSGRRLLNWRRLAIGAFAILMVWAYDQVTNKLWHYQEVGASAEAAAQLAAVLDSDLPVRTNIGDIGDLLKRGQYSALHQLFDSLQSALLADHNLEISYDALVSKISANNSIRLSDLDQWVRETENAYAYMARASYYRAAAWKRRGHRFIDRTSDQQIADFRGLFALAVTDAYRALDLNPQLLPAYTVLVEADLASALPEPVEAIVSRAEQGFPWALRFRQLRLIGLEPKWGGSYEEMNHFIAISEPYFELNPRLSILQGYVDASRANRAYKAKKYGQCVSRYSDAIAHGVLSAWLAERADCLYHLKKYQLALEDIDLSLTIDDSSRSRNIRSKILGALQ